MKCPQPILVKNKFGQVRYVDCGQCKACRINKSASWSIRIMNEAQYYDDSTFLTLTYDDEHLPENKSLDKCHLRKFLNKLFPYALGRHCRYYASGEYGEEDGKRPHYHAILFGVSPTDDIFKNKHYDRKHKGWRCQIDCWPYGFAFTAPVTHDDAQYVAKYTMKKLTGEKGREYYEKNHLQPEFAVMSLKPGIGAKYMRDNKGKLQRRGYILGKNGSKCPIPRYYKEKVLSPFFREYNAREYIREQDEQIKLKAQDTNKPIWKYREELLENARNLVDAYIKLKGAKL